MEAYSDGGLGCTNQVESFFSRLRRMVRGQHHFVSPKYLYQYATMPHGLKTTVAAQMAETPSPCLVARSSTPFRGCGQGIGGGRLDFRMPVLAYSAIDDQPRVALWGTTWRPEPCRTTHNDKRSGSTVKEAYFLGSSLDELRSFPEDVKREIGFSIETAQLGGKAINAVPLVGFKGSGVLEVYSDHDGDTYRAVYTVRFSETVYVLHAFKKKSKRGIATPRKEMEIVRSRLKIAEQHHRNEEKKKIAERTNVGTRRR